MQGAAADICLALANVKATEVILSGGSAGGLAVFYNLDHLVTLLPPNVRVTGFPDAGFFMDAPGYAKTPLSLLLLLLLL